MNKKQIEYQLKLSKKQNEDERSDYLCSQFNCVDYLIKLEKYTNNLLRKNHQTISNDTSLCVEILWWFLIFLWAAILFDTVFLCRQYSP